MPPRKASRLCKQLPEILRDDSSLSMLEYFIQYMESVKALHLVQFWLTVESFKGQGGSSPKGSHSNAAGTPNSHSQPGTPKGPGHSQPGTPKTPSQQQQQQQQQQHSPTTAAVAAAQQQQSHSHPGSPEVEQFKFRPTTSSLVASSLSSLSEPNFSTREAAEDDRFRQRASSGGSVHIRGLRRRDTENHKYCNCGISGHHHFSTSSTSSHNSSTEEQTPPLPLKVDSIIAPNKLTNGDDRTRLKHHHLDHTPHLLMESGLIPKGHKGVESLAPNHVSSQSHSIKLSQLRQL